MSAHEKALLCHVHLQDAELKEHAAELEQAQRQAQQLARELEQRGGDVADLREQLRGEAARIMELQRKAFDSRLVSEAAQQVRAVAVLISQIILNGSSTQKSTVRISCFCSESELTLPL